MKKSYLLLASTMVLAIGGCLPEANWSESAECQTLPYSTQPSYVHTWVERNALGEIDTLFEWSYQPEPARYIGSKRHVGPVVLSEPIQSETPLPQDTIHTCTHDSHSIYSVDTVFWNYGPDAMDEWVDATVQIANKTELLNSFDTLHYFSSGKVIVPSLDHFPNDSANWRIEVLTPTDVTVFYEIQVTDVPCAFNSYAPCAQQSIVCPILADAPSTKILSTGLFEAIEGHQLQWRLIASNRLGFADTLEGTSHLEKILCPAVVHNR